jgi:hypothetical protein
MRELSYNEVIFVSGGNDDIVVTAGSATFTMNMISHLFGSYGFGGGGGGGGGSAPSDPNLRDSDGDGTPDGSDEAPFDETNNTIVVTAPSLQPLPAGFVIAPFGNGKLMMAPDGVLHLTPEYAQEIAQGPQIDWTGVAIDLLQIVASSVSVLGTTAAAISLPVVAAAETMRVAQEASDAEGTRPREVGGQ